MSRQSGLIPNGKSTITAVAHRKQASVTGGMESESIRATMKLPDQIPVAANASTYPVAGLDEIDPDARMSPSLKEILYLFSVLWKPAFYQIHAIVPRQAFL